MKKLSMAFSTQWHFLMTTWYLTKCTIEWHMALGYGKLAIT